jgi:hypothetical protein
MSIFGSHLFQVYVKYTPAIYFEVLQMVYSLQVSHLKQCVFHMSRKVVTCSILLIRLYLIIRTIFDEKYKLLRP